ncbi:fluoride efflux transporter FluC [Prochlorococcus sp. MIT 1300]|uniref:fluoride efflux transporter FluC n=1 Tax=Prochlorococcus sp. MIT 1300 TaxID=3096218 RepID=UPI002A749DE0|nr:CrcB family protein [Prochlorococcus sp. MIT 1300]
MLSRFLFVKVNKIELLLIALGAILGAVIRFQAQNNFLVNIVGAAFLGFLSACSLRSNYQLFLGVGFCGALTTFSGWIVNAFELLLDGFWKDALTLVGSTLGFGLGAAAIGYWIGRRINWKGLSR